jgi:hypothetical protein
MSVRPRRRHRKAPTVMARPIKKERGKPRSSLYCLLAAYLRPLPAAKQTLDRLDRLVSGGGGAGRSHRSGRRRSHGSGERTIHWMEVLAGGVESAGADEESSLLPQALRDRTAASEAAQIRVRVIFIQTSPVSKGLEGNFLHLTGSDPIGVHTLITTGIKSGFHASALPSNYQATTYRLSPAAAVVEDRSPAGRSTVASFRRGIREITGRIAAPDHPSSPK